MPMESTIAKAVKRAADEATRRGHKLGAWGFHLGQAANRCERDGCDCRVLVTPGAGERELVGAAVALGCKEGGNAALEAPEPAPSGPESIELHNHSELSGRCLGEDAKGVEVCAYETREPEPVGATFGRKRNAA